jgi:hypothetical protein
MKSLVLILLLSLSYLTLKAQTWQSLNGGVDREVRDFYIDTTNQILYVVGRFTYAGDSIVNQIATWDGYNWGSVGVGTGDTNCSYGGCGPIRSVDKYAGDIFVGGSFWLMGGSFDNKFLSRWEGNNWVECGNPNNTGWVRVSENNKLFFLGYFDTISNQNIRKIALWNGLDWEPFGTNFLPWGNNDIPYLVSFYKDEYYFAGNFNLSGVIPEFKEIVKWKNNVWSSVGGGLTGDAYINTMAVWNGLLWVGGFFHYYSGNAADFIMAWDGEKWFNPFPGIYYLDQVFTIEVINDELFITGRYTIDGTSNAYSIARYNGVEFCTFGDKSVWPEYPPLSPQSIAGLHGNIYVGTNLIDLGDSVRFIAYLPENTPSDTCLSMPLSIHMHQMNKAISVYPNPFSSTATVEIEGANVQIQNLNLSMYNIFGQKVHEAEIPAGQTSFDIHRNNLPAGMYIIEVHSDNFRAVKKVMVE